MMETTNRMKMRLRKSTDITFHKIDLDPPAELTFDLESWLVDLLVGYWQSKEIKIKGDKHNAA